METPKISTHTPALLKSTEEFLTRYIKGEEVNLDEFDDYVGRVEVRASEKYGGRGVFATSNIHPGQLVMACYPLAMSSYEDNIPKELATDEIQLEQLVENVEEEIDSDPDTKTQFFTLYAGPQPASSTTAVQLLEKIERICKFNCFVFDDCRRRLWIAISYVNHSCWEANCFSSLGDPIMIIRAIRMIEKDEEITIPYIPPSTPYDERQTFFQDFSFQCACTLCELDREVSSPAGSERRTFLENFKTCAENEFKDVQNLLGQFEGKLVPSTVDHLFDLAKFYDKNQKNSDSLNALKMLHQIVKDSPLVGARVDCLTAILNVCFQLPDLEEAKKWVPIWKAEILISRGTMKTIKFEEQFEHVIKRMQEANINFM